MTQRRSQTLWGVLVAALAAAIWLASTPWLRAFHVPGGPALLALCALVPLALSATAARWLRLPLIATWLGSAVVLAMVLLAVNSLNAGAVWLGVDHAPVQLLTETLPLSGPAYLLAGPMALTWLAGAATGELMGRAAWPAQATLGVPLAYFVATFAATTSAPGGRTVAEGAGVLAALAVFAVARQALVDGSSYVAAASGGPGGAPPRHPSSTRRAGAGAVAAGLVVAAAAVIVPTFPAVAGKAAAVARPTPVRLGTVVDPVDVMAALRDSSTGLAVPALRAQMSEPWNGYVALAELSDYDGGTWSFAATFDPTGGRVPAPAGPAQNGLRGSAAPSPVHLSQDYQLLERTSLPLLPAVDRPVEVGGLSVNADPISGMLASSAQPPLSYSVTSNTLAVTLAGLPSGLALATGRYVPGGQTPDLTALPAGSAKDVAAAVRFAVNITGRPSSDSLAFCQDLVASLRSADRRVVPRLGRHGQLATAPEAGTSLAQVVNDVTVDQAATPEQFATYYAIVLRSLGIAARVVTGFRAGAAATATGPLPAGSYTLTDRDAWAWAEVPVRGEGWVVADPTPVATTTAAVPPPEEVRATPTTVPRQPLAVPGTHGVLHPVAPPVKVKAPAPAPTASQAVHGVAVAGGAVLAVLVALFGFPAARRRARRLGRRPEGQPDAQAAGAWLEVIDGLSRAGLDVTPAATANQVAEAVAARFGPSSGTMARVVGLLAEQAIFSQNWPVDAPAAATAWETQKRMYKGIVRGLPFRERAKALLRVGHAPSRPTVHAPQRPVAGA